LAVLVSAAIALADGDERADGISRSYQAREDVGRHG
jgi:hypothetical protein